MVKINETYRIECDYCDCILERKLENIKLDYITINYNDFGYTETEQESHYCNKNCIKAMIKTLESKYSEEELNDFGEYYMLQNYLKNN